jgi:WD40 repeat protein
MSILIKMGEFYMIPKLIPKKVSIAVAIGATISVVGFGWSKSLSQSKLEVCAPASQGYKILKGHSYWVYAIAMSPDGKILASGSYDGTIKIWNQQSGKLLLTIKGDTSNGHGDAVKSLAISSVREASSQGFRRILASGSWDNRVKLWDLENGKLIRTLTGHLDNVDSVAISLDMKSLASASWDKTVKLWNLKTGQLIRTFNHKYPVQAVAISPNGQLVASGTEDGKVTLWNLTTGQLKTPLAAHEQAVSSLSFSPDGKVLASSDYEGKVKLWNLDKGQLLNTLNGHKGAVWSVAFSPDGMSIASGGYDKTIKLWNVQNGKLLKTLSGHDKAVWSVAFDPKSDRTLASGSADETIKIWNLTGNL